MTLTLRDLIESRDFTGRKVSDFHWSIDSDTLEQLLYDRSYGNWQIADEHFTAFEKAEKLTAVAVNTWICTDSKVGMEILCLNDEPIALSWQTGRKMPREIAFLSVEAYNLLAETWEKHRPARIIPDNIVDFESLSIPIAEAGQEAYDIDEQSPVHHPHLSVRGVAQWFHDLKPLGGLASVDDVSSLENALTGVQARIEMHRRILSNLDGYPEEARVTHAEIIAKTRAESLKEIADLEEVFVVPLQERIAAIPPTPVPMQDTASD